MDVLGYLQGEVLSLKNEKPYPNYQGMKEFNSELEIWEGKMELLEDLIHELNKQEKNKNNSKIEIEICPSCKGTGRKIKVTNKDNVPSSVQVKCDGCNGSGRVRVRTDVITEPFEPLEG